MEFELREKIRINTDIKVKKALLILWHSFTQMKKLSFLFIVVSFYVIFIQAQNCKIFIESSKACYKNEKNKDIVAAKYDSYAIYSIFSASKLATVQRDDKWGLVEIEKGTKSKKKIKIKHIV